MQETKRAVVTGTSTGIGYATSLTLARNGYRVFAGMRNLAKADALRETAARDGLAVEAVEMDVTSGPSLAAAFETIHSSLRPSCSLRVCAAPAGSRRVYRRCWTSTGASARAKRSGRRRRARHKRRSSIALCAA